MPVRALLAVCAALLLSTLGHTTARAQSFVNVTHCDSVTIGGQSFPRITYNVHNLSPQLNMLQYVMHPIMHQAPSDTCHLIQLVAPSNWEGTLQDNGGAYWNATGPQGLIPPGGTVSGYQVVMSRSTCCFLFLFSSVFDVPYGGEEVCFECDRATPAKLSTWGRLKRQYR